MFNIKRDSGLTIGPRPCIHRPIPVPVPVPVSVPVAVSMPVSVPVSACLVLSCLVFVRLQLSLGVSITRFGAPLFLHPR
jgi:hypothetical protein